MRSLKKTRTTTHHPCTTDECTHRLDLCDGHVRCFVCLSERRFVAYKHLKCPHCKSFNVSSYQARQRKREKYMEEVGLPGKGATRWGSYRNPLRQGCPHPVSSEDEPGRDTPDRPDTPVSISAIHRGLQVKLALMDSLTRESEPPVSPSHLDGRTAQPPPSPPNGSLSNLSGKVRASPTPLQVTQDLPDFTSLELGSGQGEDGAISEPGEVVSPPRTMRKVGLAVTSHHWQLCAQTLFSMSLEGWSTPSPTRRRWLGLPRHNCHSVAG